MFDFSFSAAKRSSLFGGRTIRVEARGLRRNEPFYRARFLERLLLTAPAIVPFSLPRLGAFETPVTARFPGIENRPPLLLRNIRGRPLESLPGGGKPQGPEREEELFFASGVLLTPPPSGDPYPADMNELRQRAFTWRIMTRFYAFDSQSAINHSLTQRAEGLSPEWKNIISLSAAARMVPARLEEFRTGFELYRTKSWGAVFGRSPEIIGRFYLTASAKGVDVLLEETRGSTPFLPLEEQGLLGAVDGALSACGLFKRFTDAVRRAVEG